MRARLEWTRRALLDLEEIYVTIGANSVVGAERWVHVVRSRAEWLQEFPLMGQRRPEVAAGVRVLAEGLYLILYRVVDEAEPHDARVQVVRVVDGRRDLSRLRI